MAEREPLPAAVDWETFWAEHPLEPGQHVSIFGPTGTGKTYTLIALAESFPTHAVLVVTKGADQIVNRLVTERGWVLATEVDDVFARDGSPGRLLKKTWGDRWEKRRGRPPQRIVFKPKVLGGSVRGRGDQLQTQVEALIDRAYEYCAHAQEAQLMVAVDETMFAAMELDLSRPLVILWNEGRSMGLSVVAAMQRPAWIPKSSKSAPSYVVVFDTTEADDTVDLSRLLGVEPRAVRGWLEQLPEHHHLLAQTRGRGRQVRVSKVVIRKMGSESRRARER